MGLMMGASLPLVSIGMPVFNGEQTIGQALDALLAQDYENFELTVSDNGSTDCTQEICNQYAAKDARVRYHRYEVNKGSVWNFNHVFELSSGKYFMWAAHDDWHNSTFISKCVKELEKNSSAVLCYTLVQFVDPHGQLMQVVDCELNTYRLNWLERLHTVILRMQADTAMYGLIRVDALRRTTLIQDTYYSDKNLLYQLAILGDIVKVPEVLHYYRYVEKNLDQYAEQLGFDTQSKEKRPSPVVSLKRSIIKAIFKLDVPNIYKPFLLIDALHCLKRRFANHLKQDME